MDGGMDGQSNGWWANGGTHGLKLGLLTSLTAQGVQDKGNAWKRRLSTHIRQLADGVRFDCDVVLLQFLLDFINALRDILCLKGKVREKL